MLKDNYTREDFKNAVKKNYADKFSTDEKIIMTLRAFIANGKIQNKDKLRYEIDTMIENA